MYKQEVIFENEIHKVLGNFEIQTENLVLARASDS